MNDNDILRFEDVQGVFGNRDRIVSAGECVGNSAVVIKPVKLRQEIVELLKSV